MKRPWHMWWGIRGEAEVRAILNERWDPIGVAGEDVEDEYDAYVPRVGALLREGASVDALAAYLSSVRTERLALPPDTAADRDVAVGLRDWYDSSQSRRARTE